jgi:hypothetical protein
MKRLCLLLVLCLGLVAVPACATTPVTANLSPTGLAEYNQTRVIKVLDVIRDAAIDGEKFGVFSHTDTVNVVTYHKSAVQVIAAGASGWKAAVQTGLDETLKHLTPSARTKVGPYAPLVTALLQEI